MDEISEDVHIGGIADTSYTAHWDGETWSVLKKGDCGIDKINVHYIAMDIGCIECGENSALLGVFSSEDKAQKACDEASACQESNWHGQHSFEVFEWNGKIDTAIIPSYGK